MSPALNSSGTNPARQEADPVEPSSDDTGTRSTSSRLIDLAALLILVSVPLMLVLVGHADTGTVLAVGEFLIAGLGVWRYQGYAVKGSRRPARRPR